MPSIDVKLLSLIDTILQSEQKKSREPRDFHYKY